jgi:hypothetical protein
MGAKANLKSKFSTRYVTGDPARAPYRSYRFVAGLTNVQAHADFKPAGRYAAKDVFEAGGVPLLDRRVGSVFKGAVTHWGGSAEISTYADI